MRKIKNGLVVLVCVLLLACGKKEERFNYTLIKSKLDLTEEQTAQFDEITAEHLKRAHDNFNENKGDREKAMENLQQIFAEQDQKIKALIGEQQYEVYIVEMKIEREGREKYNMKLIRQELALDSAQAQQFDIANEAFYTALINEHDNYHGKPDVYLQYYAELNTSREAAFKKIMTEEQFNSYTSLYQQYGIGKSEH